MGSLSLLQITDFLGSVSLFRGLARESLQRIAEVTREKRYPKGSVIVFADDPGDSLYIVRAGRVKVVLLGEDGREVILGVLGVGEHFGELALIDDQPRSAHVIAMEDSLLVVLRRDDFRRRVEAEPAVAWAMLTEMSRRLRVADKKIGGLVLLDVPGRIARVLLENAPDESTNVVQRRLTHQTIAQMIGASRETVSRAMRDFQEAGWIAVERRVIRLTDRAALIRRATIRV
ncbi:MAG TPA: Crp/Fnr family transcriptional regulator [Gemmatimonadaceae bacterium]|jgi:CRP/FNR family cyclic AMP-dependent transcriptional regulator